MAVVVAAAVGGGSGGSGGDPVQNAYLLPNTTQLCTQFSSFCVTKICIPSIALTAPNNDNTTYSKNHVCYLSGLLSTNLIY